MTELRLLGETTGATIYAVVVRDSDELIWNGSAFVTRVNANHATYAVTMIETPSGARVWLGDFPTGIIDNGSVNYHVDYYLQISGSPQYTDTILGGENMTSSGTAAVTPVTAGLITIAEYDLQVSNTLSNDAKTFLISSATEAIEHYCNRKFIQVVNREEVHNGTGFGYLQLRGVPASVTTVTLDYQGTSQKDVDGSNFNWTENGLLYPLPSSNTFGVFDSGFLNIKVKYTTSGVVDYALRQACVMVVLGMSFMNDAEQYVTEKSNKDQKIKWDLPDFEDAIFGPAKALLTYYVQPVCI